MTPIDPSDPRIKAALKEALTEWLNDQFSLFGKWTLHSLMAIVFAAAVMLFLWMQGGHK